MEPLKQEKTILYQGDKFELESKQNFLNKQKK